MDHIQALNSLYNAARLAPLNAADHELVKKCAEQLLEALKIKAVPDASEGVKTP
jgi:hypothetical protein